MCEGSEQRRGKSFPQRQPRQPRRLLSRQASQLQLFWREKEGGVTPPTLSSRTRNQHRSGSERRHVCVQATRIQRDMGCTMMCPGAAATVVTTAPRSSRRWSASASSSPATTTMKNGAVPHRQCDATTSSSVRQMRRVVSMRRSAPRRGGSVAVRASGIEQAISDLATGVGLPCTVSVRGRERVV